AEKIPFVFDRFYQADDSSTRAGEGTGIGLALTKELVQLLKGDIKVNSRLGKGAEFTLLLPVTNKENKIAVIPPPKDAFETDLDNLENPTISASLQTPSEASRILLIEDNHDVIRYIISCLNSSYHIEVAYNGEQGIEKAMQSIPDLIISDVMMPRKDGFEVCDSLKKDERTSHIPIILLTAKADLQSKLSGLAKGADVYLSKPFNKQELLLRTQKLLESRRKLQKYYLSKVNSSGKKRIVTSGVKPEEKIELEFLQKVRSVVEAHLTDYTFSVEKLAVEVTMSEAQLYRKMKGITGLSPGKFIRSIKIAKAKELLSNPTLSITAVAFDSGFQDPEYFSRVFKKETGVTPTEFRKG
ncbi:MAG: response regulator, partial [Bacteroidetes bacterium]|nr:response regulator [Bacteroidota bacterium]